MCFNPTKLATTTLSFFLMDEAIHDIICQVKEYVITFIFIKHLHPLPDILVPDFPRVIKKNWSKRKTIFQ